MPPPHVVMDLTQYLRPCRRPHPLASLQWTESSASLQPQPEESDQVQRCPLNKTKASRTPPVCPGWGCYSSDAPHFCAGDECNQHLNFWEKRFPTRRSLLSRGGRHSAVSPWKLFCMRAELRVSLSLTCNNGGGQVDEFLWMLFSDYSCHPHSIRDGRWVVSEKEITSKVISLNAVWLIANEGEEAT